MPVLRTIVLLAGVVCSVLFPILFGHGLSVGGGRVILYASAFLIVGAALIGVAARMPAAGDSDRGR
jgi:hypothetical protein